MNDRNTPGGSGDGGTKGQRAVVLHPDVRVRGKSPRDPDLRLEEAVGLTEAISLDVVLAQVVRVDTVRPATFIGGGAIENLVPFVEANEVDLVIVDTALTPVQQRNLERAFNTKVIDRTGLILEIFGERARTHEGRLQVELASLSYQRSRLVRSWTHLERQRGGFGFMGGPGESQIEIDRRLIDERIGKIKRQLEDVKRTRGLQRRARERVPYPVIALVGYTNAGKSTLFNRLTSSQVMAQDLLFATLDPTMRALRLPSGRNVILSDTVGFISDLPTDLVAAFRATLEEVLSADVLVHVRDISHEETETQKTDVEQVLASLELGEDTPVIEAWNKVDILDSQKRAVIGNLAVSRDDVVPISAVTGEGVGSLLDRIEDALMRSNAVLTFLIPGTEGDAIAWLYRNGQVRERVDGEDGVQITVALSPEAAARFSKRFSFEPVE